MAARGEKSAVGGQPTEWMFNQPPDLIRALVSHFGRFGGRHSRPTCGRARGEGGGHLLGNRWALVPRGDGDVAGPKAWQVSWASHAWPTCRPLPAGAQPVHHGSFTRVPRTARWVCCGVMRAWGGNGRGMPQRLFWGAGTADLFFLGTVGAWWRWWECGKSLCVGGGSAAWCCGAGGEAWEPLSPRGRRGPGHRSLPATETCCRAASHG